MMYTIYDLPFSLIILGLIVRYLTIVKLHILYFISTFELEISFAISLSFFCFYKPLFSNYLSKSVIYIQKRSNLLIYSRLILNFEHMISILSLSSFCYRFQLIFQILSVDFTFYGNKIEMYSFPYLHVNTEKEFRMGKS